MRKRTGEKKLPPNAHLALHAIAKTGVIEFDQLACHLLIAKIIHVIGSQLRVQIIFISLEALHNVQRCCLISSICASHGAAER